MMDKVDKVGNHPSNKVTEEEKALREKIKWWVYTPPVHHGMPE